MRHHHSKVEVFVHYVWTTKKRATFLIEPEVERAVWRCVQQQAQELRCPVLKIGGTPDHVHLLVKLHSTVAIANLIKTVKGVSSHFANDQLHFGRSFDWQNNYGAFSVSDADIPTICAYIANQKTHHRDKTQIDEWETTFETVEYN